MLNLRVWIDCAISQFYFRLVNPLVEGKVDNVEKYLLCTTDFFFFYCYLEPQANARAQELLLFFVASSFFFFLVMGQTQGFAQAS